MTTRIVASRSGGGRKSDGQNNRALVVLHVVTRISNCQRTQLNEDMSNNVVIIH